ncbi:cell division protease FtsH [Cetobacterium ceti]|uniref:ATP-dependent zinc metalloprotease FtsH n=1 Tax=Cetobacterium ceti TaxID=180163 RepID=A0A1T4JWK8_9FUSO|nr:ATP-dependent zinc metalloprotease FtsH [Cetobacterium ceti]SJZ34576.1 cell division protease FtsH [Cetobacterium ceti]
MEGLVEKETLRYLSEDQEDKKNEKDQTVEDKNKDDSEYDELGERKKELKAKLKHGMRKGGNLEDEEEDENPKGSKRPRGGKFNFKGFIMLLFVITLFMSLPSLFSDTNKGNLKSVSYTEFVKLADNKDIKIVNEKEGYVYGYASKDEKEGFKTRLITDRLGQDPTLLKTFEDNNITIDSLAPQQLPFILNILVSWFPMLLLIGVWIFMLNKMNRGGGGGPQMFNMGKSKAKENGEEISKVTFKDVAGIDEAKEELEEVVQFLKEPEKFKKLGAKIPKGVLLLGSPGTGKTLLAKAVAGEAGVPFFSMSGSEFVEMFVGVGASRVRDLFNKARKNSPCIIFIDEIDAVGRKRGSGQGGGNDEREQTLNQLLVEMDGFGNEETIIVLAATNRPEILDKALMRPGRFDRQVVVDRPDLKGREEILKVHARNKKFADDVDFHTVARKTPGFVGADIANLLNEAAILAAREGRDCINMADLEEASEKVTIGPERKSRVTVQKERVIVAYHEVGHALTQKLSPLTEPVHKVTIVPRGMAALGYTMSLPMEDRYLKSKNEYLSELVTLLGGRASEEVVFGDITTGASNDIERATAIAHAMVTKFGMTDKFGPILLDNTKEGDMFQQKYYGESTGKEVDAEILKLVNDAYTQAKKILTDNRELLEKITQELLVRETITGEELDLLIEGKDLEPLHKPEKEPKQEELKEETTTSEEIIEEKEVEILDTKDEEDEEK